MADPERHARNTSEMIDFIQEMIDVILEIVDLGDKTTCKLRQTIADLRMD